MSRISRFGLGGLGGLLPVLATLVAVDLSSIATLIDNHGITQGLCVGYTIRVLGLFALGGIMAAINSEVTAPIALVQIGIAAPALVTSYMTGAAINKTQPQVSVSSMIISAAHAEQQSPNAEPNNVMIAGGFFGDLIMGITPGGLARSADDINRALEKAGQDVAALQSKITLVEKKADEAQATASQALAEARQNKTEIIHCWNRPFDTSKGITTYSFPLTCDKQMKSDWTYAGTLVATDIAG